MRIGLASYAAAFDAAEPSLATAPERRVRLAAAIVELADAGVVRPSTESDRSQSPPLPRFLAMCDRESDPAAERAAASFPWRPELAWAARLPLRGTEFEVLRAVQAFLRDRAPTAPVVPIGERSLELFGDEKWLDRLLRSERLFAPGRLTLALLRARRCPPPFVYRVVGDGPVALVLENAATWHSVLATLPPGGPVGMVVFGGGALFAASVTTLADLDDARHVGEIRYFGDLDRSGLEIPLAADAAARAVGLPAVRPAIGLWATLLRVGRPAEHERADPDTANRAVAWLPASLRGSAHRVLTDGHRLAQEAVGTELLGADPSWACWAQLGPPGLVRFGEIDPAELRDDDGLPASTGPWVGSRDVRNGTARP